MKYCSEIFGSIILSMTSFFAHVILNMPWLSIVDFLDGFWCRLISPTNQPLYSVFSDSRLISQKKPSAKQLQNLCHVDVDFLDGSWCGLLYRMLASKETTWHHTQAIQVCERRDQGPVFFSCQKKKTPQAVVGKHRLKTIDNGYGCC